ncbi:MAG: putative glycoside hydrolase, partial [Gemmatimonadetes bacterium]|nr:putative glycoside hydrolase [Gemmatimonadota bacterium]
VRAQIQATYDAGVMEWILWNPGSSYTESALMPKGGLPSWLEPVMRVGGEVVPISKRFEVLGERPPETTPVPEDTLVLPGLVVPSEMGRSPSRTLPAIPIPDTGGVRPARPTSGGGRD